MQLPFPVGAACLAQVKNTGDIAVGQWVRIVALERYRGVGRRLLAGAAAASNLSSAGAQRAEGVLPLTTGLLRAVELGRDDLLADQEAVDSQDGVQAAAAVGSLDAYLHGDMPDLNSGKSERASACCLLRVART